MSTSLATGQKGNVDSKNKKCLRHRGDRTGEQARAWAAQCRHLRLRGGQAPAVPLEPQPPGQIVKLHCVCPHSRPHGDEALCLGKQLEAQDR